MQPLWIALLASITLCMKRTITPNASDNCPEKRAKPLPGCDDGWSMETMPDEMVVEIIKFMSVHEQAKLTLVSKRMQSLLSAAITQMYGIANGPTMVYDLSKIYDVADAVGDKNSSGYLFIRHLIFTLWPRSESSVKTSFLLNEALVFILNKIDGISKSKCGNNLEFEHIPGFPEVTKLILDNQFARNLTLTSCLLEEIPSECILNCIEREYKTKHQSFRWRSEACVSVEYNHADLLKMVVDGKGALLEPFIKFLVPSECPLFELILSNPEFTGCKTETVAAMPLIIDYLIAKGPLQTPYLTELMRQALDIANFGSISYKVMVSNLVGIEYPTPYDEAATDLLEAMSLDASHPIGDTNACIRAFFYEMNGEKREAILLRLASHPPLPRTYCYLFLLLSCAHSSAPMSVPKALESRDARIVLDPALFQILPGGPSIIPPDYYALVSPPFPRWNFMITRLRYSEEETMAILKANVVNAEAMSLLMKVLFDFVPICPFSDVKKNPAILRFIWSHLVSNSGPLLGNTGGHLVAALTLFALSKPVAEIAATIAKKIALTKDIEDDECRSALLLACFRALVIRGELGVAVDLVGHEEFQEKIDILWEAQRSLEDIPTTRLARLFALIFPHQTNRESSFAISLLFAVLRRPDGLDVLRRLFKGQLALLYNHIGMLYRTENEEWASLIEENEVLGEMPVQFLLMDIEAGLLSASELDTAGLYILRS